MTTPDRPTRILKSDSAKPHLDRRRRRLTELDYRILIQSKAYVRVDSQAFGDTWRLGLVWTGDVEKTFNLRAEDLVNDKTYTTSFQEEEAGQKAYNHFHALLMAVVGEDGDRDFDNTFLQDVHGVLDERTKTEVEAHLAAKEQRREEQEAEAEMMKDVRAAITGADMNGIASATVTHPKIEVVPAFGPKTEPEKKKSLFKKLY